MIRKHIISENRKRNYCQNQGPTIEATDKTKVSKVRDLQTEKSRDRYRERAGRWGERVLKGGV